MLWHVENGWLPSVQDETRQADAAMSSQSLRASIKRRVPAIPSARIRRGSDHAVRERGRFNGGWQDLWHFRELKASQFELA
jgi:hypothetical protein